VYYFCLYLTLYIQMGKGSLRYQVTYKDSSAATQTPNAEKEPRLAVVDDSAIAVYGVYRAAMRASFNDTGLDLTSAVKSVWKLLRRDVRFRYTWLAQGSRLDCSSLERPQPLASRTWLRKPRAGHTRRRRFPEVCSRPRCHLQRSGCRGVL
jgi:hypothetical protein